jgi:hypothetical protein
MAPGRASAIGTWFAHRHDAVLHGLGTKRHADLHLFNDNEYIRRNLLNGYRDVGHFPIFPADPALQMTPS